MYWRKNNMHVHTFVCTMYTIYIYIYMYTYVRAYVNNVSLIELYSRHFWYSQGSCSCIFSFFNLKIAGNEFWQFPLPPPIFGLPNTQGPYLCALSPIEKIRQRMSVVVLFWQVESGRTSSCDLTCLRSFSKLIHWAWL